MRARLFRPRFSPTWRGGAFAAALACLVLPSCGRQETAKTVEGADGGAPRAPAEAAVEPPVISDQDRAAFQAFADDLAAAVREGDVEQIDGMIDYDGLLDLVLDGIDPDSKDVRDFRIGFMAGIKGGRGVGSEWAGGLTKVLRYHEEDGVPLVLVRAASPAGGGGYMDLELVRMGDGTIKGRDLRNHGVGEKNSETVRRLVLPSLLSSDRPALVRLFEGKHPMVEHFDEWVAFIKATQEGNVPRAIELYDNLPEAIRNDKYFMQAYMTILDIENPDQLSRYQSAVDDYMVRYADDPSADFIGLDFHFFREDFPEALACVEGLIERFGEDAHLAELRSRVLYEQDRLDEARAEAEKAIRLEPDYEDAYFLLLDLCADQQDFARLAECLRTLEDDLEYDMTGLAETTEFAGFMESPEGREWWGAKERSSPAEMLPDPPDGDAESGK